MKKRTIFNLIGQKFYFLFFIFLLFLFLFFKGANDSREDFVKIERA